MPATVPRTHELVIQGFIPAPPNQLIAELDRLIAENEVCPKCQSSMRYEPWTRYGVTIQYRAFAGCRTCDYRVEI